MTPTTVRKFLDKGFKVNFERNPVRIFEDEEFKDAGATFVKEGSWRDAPNDHIIKGFKGLLEEDCTFSGFLNSDAEADLVAK